MYNDKQFDLRMHLLYDDSLNATEIVYRRVYEGKSLKCIQAETATNDCSVYAKGI